MLPFFSFPTKLESRKESILAFLFDLEVVGWALSLAVAIAAGVALAGFCLGCFLYFRHRMNRYKLFGGRAD